MNLSSRYFSRCRSRHESDLAVSVKSFISGQWNRCLDHSHQTFLQKSLLNMNYWTIRGEEEHNLVPCCRVVMSIFRIKRCSVRLYPRLFTYNDVRFVFTPGCLPIMMSNLLLLFILLDLCVCHRSVSCVPNVVIGFSNVNCPIGFL